jgi:hypothetical protein
MFQNINIIEVRKNKTIVYLSKNLYFAFEHVSFSEWQ